MQLPSLRLAVVLLAAIPQVLGLALPRATSPDTDPFYQPPAGFESKPLGTVLRSRLIVAAFFGFVPDPIVSYQLLFRTESLNGTAIAGVTTVFKPLISRSDRFVSFHTAYDSSAPKCDPSWAYELGGPQNNTVIPEEFLLVQGYLLQGYTVSSPDYEGPEAAFTAGRLSGRVVLDSMRAVKNFRFLLGLNSNPDIVGVGYSGGAIATGWAAGLHPTYAPDLSVKGWASGGTPANLTGVLVYIDGTSNAGYLPDAVSGLLKPSAYQAELQSTVDMYLTQEGKDVIAYTSANCAQDDLGKYGGISIFDPKFQTLGRALLYLPTLVQVLGQCIMGTYKQETPIAPYYLYHSMGDEIIPYANASSLNDRWCANGASVEFTSYTSGAHATTAVNGYIGVLGFVDNAFNGQTTPGCTSKSAPPSPVDFGALNPLLVPLVEALEKAIGL